MTGPAIEVTLILLLVAANGIFAMAEIALVSARKGRLEQLANEGDRRARTALRLAADPDEFLSTVQVGITLVGTLAGAFGGATLARHLVPYFAQVPLLEPYAETISLSIVVAIISYLSLILGELVPKRIGLARPERIAILMAVPMRGLSRMGAPAVRLLTWSTDIVLRLVPLKAGEESAVTQEEIKSLLAQGTSVGNFAPEEQQMVAGVFRLGNRRVVEVMTPRHNVCWLDVHGRREQLLETLAACPHSRLPLCDGELDRLIGIVHVKDVALALARQQPFGLREMARPSLVVPEHMDALALVDQFREKGSHIAVVVSEHGGIEGVVTPADLLEAIAGPMHEPGDLQTRRIVPREDGSWLVDGLVPVTDLKELLQVSRLPHEDEHDFATVGGFLMAGLGRVPAAADVLEWPAARVEVVDMDGNRVDKVLVTKHRAADAEEDS